MLYLFHLQYTLFNIEHAKNQVNKFGYLCLPVIEMIYRVFFLFFFSLRKRVMGS